MSETTTGRFLCEACNRSYRWKPELASRKVKCKCGHIMTAPANEPGEDGDLYDLVPDEQAHAPKKSHAHDVLALEESMRSVSGMRLATPLGVESPDEEFSTNPVTPPTVAYAGSVRKREPDLENTVGGPLWREILLPVGLVLIGTAIQVLSQMYRGNGQWLSLRQVMPVVGMALAIDLVLTFACVMLIAKLMDISFGSPGPAVLKLAAIALLVPALASFIGMVVGYDSGFVRFMVGSLVTFPLAAVGFWFLFDLDFGDAVYCVMILWAINHLALPFILGFFASTGL